MSIGSRLNQLEQAAGSALETCPGCGRPIRLVLRDFTICAPEPVGTPRHSERCGHLLSHLPAGALVIDLLDAPAPAAGSGGVARDESEAL